MRGFLLLLVLLLPACGDGTKRGRPKAKPGEPVLLHAPREMPAER